MGLLEDIQSIYLTRERIICPEKLAGLVSEFEKLHEPKSKISILLQKLLDSKASLLSIIQISSTYRKSDVLTESSDEETINSFAVNFEESDEIERNNSASFLAFQSVKTQKRAQHFDLEKHDQFKQFPKTHQHLQMKENISKVSEPQQHGESHFQVLFKTPFCYTHT